MASLTRKFIKGKPYYCLCECRRVNGKPKIIWQEYIGAPQQLVLRLMSPKPQEIIVREFEASAAAFDIAQQLEIVSVIDRHVPKEGNQGPSVGEYLLVACLNRCIAFCSKAKTGEQIVMAYRSRSHVEAAFRLLKGALRSSMTMT